MTEIHPAPRWFLLSIALVLAVFGAACSSSTTTDNANYAEVESIEAEVDPAMAEAAADLVNEGLAPSITDDVAEIELLFSRFLQLRASVIVGDSDVSTMSTVTTKNAMGQVQGLRDDNDAKRREEAVSTVTALAEWPNITSIEKRGDRIIFTDCTERQQINDLGTEDLLFVTQEVFMTVEDGARKIDRVDVIQDGVVAVSANDLGCVPPSFAKRAEAIAEQSVATVAALASDPTQATARELPAIFAEPARTELAEVLGQLDRAGKRLPPTEQVRYDVLGLDVHEPGITAVVSVCRLFPEGRFLVDQDTGVAGDSDLEPGTSEEERIFIRLESISADAGPTDVVTRTELGNTNCWKG